MLRRNGKICTTESLGPDLTNLLQLIIYISAIFQLGLNWLEKNTVPSKERPPFVSFRSRK